MLKGRGVQLPLQIGMRDDCTLATYYPGENREALRQIQDMASGKGELFLYLWGREGVGRSHLLQGACVEASQHQLAAIYFPLQSLLKMNPKDVLENAESLNLVCLDDIEVIAGNIAWEEAIFHLFNRLRTANHRLLVAGNKAPTALGITLKDLQSRLTWGITYPLHPLDDEALLAALQLRANERGIVLPDEVGTFLIKRCSRAMPDLYQKLDILDKASLVAQRRLTIPFVKSVLDL